MKLVPINRLPSFHLYMKFLSRGICKDFVCLVYEGKFLVVNTRPVNGNSHHVLITYPALSARHTSSPPSPAISGASPTRPRQRTTLRQLNSSKASKMALAPKFAGQRFSVASAPVLHTLELYLDYVCPYSLKMFNTMYTSVFPLIREKYSSKVQVIFRQQIQPWHPSSTLVHEAGVAVLKLQPAKFWDFSKVGRVYLIHPF